ncbi:hypothetical protein TNCV_3780721 [Trichonephila clavipes]|nr:hypothetical protein TNCV_3780721 [Trichonephila clavipes]
MMTYLANKQAKEEILYIPCNMWACISLLKDSSRDALKEGNDFVLLHWTDVLHNKDQTIEITASCDVWMMTKSVVSVIAIVGYNCCHTPRHRFNETLDVSLGYSSPCGFHILPNLIWSSSEFCIPGLSLYKLGPLVFIGDRSGLESNSI